MILRKILLITLLTWFALTVFGYGVYKALPIMLGPKIEISSPQNGDIVTGTSIIVRGTVLRSQSLFINGVTTPFTEDGVFQTKVAVYSGSNILVFTAEDKFGRSTTQTINIGTN